MQAAIEGTSGATKCHSELKLNFTRSGVPALGNDPNGQPPHSDMSFNSVSSVADVAADDFVSELSRMQIKAQAIIAHTKQTGRMVATNLVKGEADMDAP